MSEGRDDGPAGGSRGVWIGGGLLLVALAFLVAVSLSDGPRGSADRGEGGAVAESSLQPAGAEGGEAADRSATEEPEVVVFKSPTCGCCAGWVAHMRENGFEVRAEDRPDLTGVKRELGVPLSLTSCHTATVDGYVIEGHVPADVVRRLLEERPEVEGLAVPGMPVGSPGMEGPNPQPYEVVAFGGEGGARVYARR